LQKLEQSIKTSSNGNVFIERIVELPNAWLGDDQLGQPGEDVLLQQAGSPSSWVVSGQRTMLISNQDEEVLGTAEQGDDGLLLVRSGELWHGLDQMAPRAVHGELGAVGDEDEQHGLQLGRGDDGIQLLHAIDIVGLEDVHE
jgi:hypothetical protein